MADFHEIRFPEKISLGSSGGPQRRTDVVTLASGREQRNALWANSRRSYDAGYGVTTPDQLHAVIEFFEARNGRLYGFRWKDWADFKSCPPQTAVTPSDQVIGTGDGATASFQLVKAYVSGGVSWTRTITKPVAGTIRVQVAGIEQTALTDFTLAHATGLVTFTAGHIPAIGEEIRAGFEFDVPVRFDTDALSVNLAHAGAGGISSIPLIEIR